MAIDELDKNGDRCPPGEDVSIGEVSCPDEFSFPIDVSITIRGTSGRRRAFCLARLCFRKFLRAIMVKSKLWIVSRATAERSSLIRSFLLKNSSILYPIKLTS